jgi:pyruvate formate lyase activating enzyme
MEYTSRAGALVIITIMVLFRVMPDWGEQGFPSRRKEKLGMIGTREDRGVVFDVRRYSVQDGPGIRTTVFFKGCPLRCLWCHNPESQEFQPFRVEKKLRLSGITIPSEEWCGREMTVVEVLAEVERDWPFYEESGGGVTISGGEPFAQPEFLGSLLAACRQRGLHTCVDTCGHIDPRWIQGLSPMIDLFLYDLKVMDAELHRQFTGVNNHLVLSNLRTLARNCQALIIRFPLIPGYTNRHGNLEAVASFVAGLPGKPAMHILPYHRIFEDKCRRFGLENRLAAAEPPTPEMLAAAADCFTHYGLSVQIGG